MEKAQGIALFPRGGTCTRGINGGLGRCGQKSVLGVAWGQVGQKSVGAKRGETHAEDRQMSKRLARLGLGKKDGSGLAVGAKRWCCCYVLGWGERMWIAARSAAPRLPAGHQGPPLAASSTAEGAWGEVPCACITPWCGAREVLLVCIAWTHYASGAAGALAGAPSPASPSLSLSADAAL